MSDENGIVKIWDDLESIFKDGKIIIEELPTLLKAIAQITNLILGALSIIGLDVKVTVIIETIIKTIEQMAGKIENETPKIKESWKKLSDILEDERIRPNEIPDFMKKSHIYTANNLGRFGLVDTVPEDSQVIEFIDSCERVRPSEETFFRYHRHQDYENMLKVALAFADNDHPKSKTYLEYTAQCALECDAREFAWKVALFCGKVK